MKKSTYRVLTSIPIVRQVAKVCLDPIPLYGSQARADGTTKRIMDLYEEYSKDHPGEQLTRQLMNKLLSGEKTH